MKVITSIDDAASAVGQELGVSEWLLIDQKRINDFADATNDHQWIHVDVERAKAESPYGAPIAHGFLTLSLVPALSKDNFRLENAKMAINYGLNKVRFMSPVPVDSSVRVRSELAGADKVDDNTVNMTVKHTIEIDGVDKPAAVAEMIVRALF
ncbi:acyl dehydratase [Mycolicibacterium sp. BK556]|uniref:MaoC family dehydratase n=1 Tax=Mycobacteriaceae TaxID=1762 RepID=UPI00106143B5|nr:MULTISPECIES: MaoC family dehydratase [Mycobacteriaceae]MBB3600724.1 acyl dehydratase [Mycolicibacterium sp. BK556]MBB3630478.1 acyl dehydratase [Mycolicibacterium sp. BK607]MBB3748469.1 acyl dehydratase [Mycolicibacterium sp. BK634]TDO10265.1 acyl dehydratase [Mycobacterium sp. BK086]